MAERNPHPIIEAELRSISSRYMRKFRELDSEASSGPEVPRSIDHVTERLESLLSVLRNFSNVTIELSGGVDVVTLDPAPLDPHQMEAQVMVPGLELTLQLNDYKQWIPRDATNPAVYVGSADLDLYIHGLTIASALNAGGGFAIRGS